MKKSHEGGRPRVVVPDDHPSVFATSAAADQLRAFADVRIVSEPGAHQEEELIQRIGDAEGVINIRAYARYSTNVIAACKRLRAISIWGTGTDNVDMAACAARGVAVFNTPGVNAHAVAEHAIALALAVLRKLTVLDAGLRTGSWARAPLGQLEGKTVGVIGFGAIGTRVAHLASAFGARVIVHTRTPDNGRAAAHGARAVAIDDLFREAEVVCVCMRLEAASAGFIGRSRLALMKPTAILVNTSRGALVDKTALIDALSANQIAGAGLDVFHEEPIPAGDPILSLPNVVLTPHVAGNTPEVIAAGLGRAVENLREFFS